MEMQSQEIISSAHGCSPQQADHQSSNNDISRFDKSLQELKDLRSQLHFAADYCEKTFLKANEKKLVMENTKEYICRAFVTFVDHLGSVSTNLELRLSKNNVVPEVELRINSLKQRLLSCEKYAHKVALTKLCYNPDFPRHHSHYIAPYSPNLEKLNDESRTMSDHGSEDDLPVLLYINTHELPPTIVSSPGFDFSTSVPVQNVSPMSSKPQTPFLFQSTQKLRREGRARKLVHSNDILSLLRRSKRDM